MTAHRDLKKVIRARQSKTGESYTAARIHVLRGHSALLGHDPQARKSAEPQRADAAVLKANRQSARVRIFGEEGEVTFRAPCAFDAVPGHIVTLAIERRWNWHGDDYALGEIENPRVDIPKLGLEPLPLQGGELEDVAAHTEPFRRPDPYAPLWKKLAAKPRPSFEFHDIAWGTLPGLDLDENPTCDAAELAQAGDCEGARELLMETLCADLRCIDAHAHLGNLAFDLSPERAMLHYEIGIGIAELSLPADFNGLLSWGHIYNRPFLRCLHGYGLCLWRLDRFQQAERVFERILSLSPNDNQGVRFCWHDVRQRRSWVDAP